MVAIVKSRMVEVEQRGEVVAVKIHGYYFRAVHAWELCVIEGEIRGLPNIPDIYKQDALLEIRRIQKGFRAKVEADDSIPSGIADDTGTVMDHVAAASLCFLVLLFCFVIIWSIRFVW